MSNTLTYQGHTYNDNEIVSGTSAKTQSLNMRELSVDSASFTLRPILHLEFFTNEPFPFFTKDGKRFYTSEANPLAGGVVQNAPIKQYIDGSQVAVWLAKSIDRIDRDKYRLSCVSPLGLLMQKTHYGGIYSGSKTVSDVVAELMGDAAYFISPEFENIALYGWLPIAPARDNLMQVLFAVNAALTTDADGTLRIGNLSTTPSAVVGAGDIYASGATVEYQAPVTQVVLLEHNFVVGVETRKLFDGVTSDRQLIPFGQPMTNLQATGFTILDSNANYAIVSAGRGVLTGTPYIDTTREIVRSVAEADVPNEVRVEKATLVGITASSDVADRLQEYYRHRSLIKVAVADKLPRGSIRIYDPYDGNVVDACVEASELAISAVEKTSISALVGFSPWQTIPFQDIREVLTGSGTWTVPGGVTEVTAVLIGAGEDGADGENGGAGQSTELIITSAADTKGGTWTTRPGNGGAGGAGGQGGTGGKVFRVSVTVIPDETFTYSIGVQDSVFSVYSSANGAASETGYFDPITSTFFAKRGTDGNAGGAGGTGGQAGNDVAQSGHAGDPVGSYIGGNGAGGTYRNIPESSSAYSGGQYTSRGGGGGGGAADSANGGDATGVNGGAGANGVAGIDGINYGDGGAGGNGGGGGGGGCGFYNRHGAYKYGGQSPGYWATGDGGAGGAGGSGGAGAPGCIILYYRKPVPESGT